MSLIIRFYEAESAAREAADELTGDVRRNIGAGKNYRPFVPSVLTPEADGANAVAAAVADGTLTRGEGRACDAALEAGRSVVLVECAFGTSLDAQRILDGHGPVDTDAVAQRNPQPVTFFGFFGMPELWNVSFSQMIGKSELWNVSFSRIFGKSELWNTSFSRMIGKPELWDVSFSRMIGKPELWNVSFSQMIGKPELWRGSFSQMIGKPELWNVSFSQMIGKPELIRQGQDADERA